MFGQGCLDSHPVLWPVQVTESVGALLDGGQHPLAEGGRTCGVTVAAVDQESAVKGCLQAADLPCHGSRIQVCFAREGRQGGKAGGFKEP